MILKCDGVARRISKLQVIREFQRPPILELIMMAMSGDGVWIDKEWDRVLCELGGGGKVVTRHAFLRKQTLHGLRGTADTYFDL